MGVSDFCRITFGCSFISEILCIQIKIIRSNYRTASVELCLIGEVRDDSLNQIIYVAGFWTGEYNVRVPSLHLFSLFYSACSQDILYTFCAWKNYQLSFSANYLSMPWPNINLLIDCGFELWLSISLALIYTFREHDWQKCFKSEVIPVQITKFNL